MTKEMAVEKIIEQLKEIITCEEFQAMYKTTPSCFTRTRKLSFTDIIYFVLGLCAKTLNKEREHFQEASEKTITNAAICRARDKISEEAFREMLLQVQKQIKPINLWNRKQLIAVDGMRGSMPNTAILRETYPGNKGNSPQFHATMFYDVLNNHIIDAELLPAPADEREVFLHLMENHPSDAKKIYVLDRGYPSLLLIAQLTKQGHQYVMRCQKSFLTEVNDFMASAETDSIIEIEYDKKRAKGKKKPVGIELPYVFKMRCVKIQLNEQETECLLTNLPRRKYPTEAIGEIYRLRWNAETINNHLKHSVFIESFISKKENSIKQEFYGRLITYNLTEEIVEMAEEDDPYRKKRISSNTR